MPLVPLPEVEPPVGEPAEPVIIEAAVSVATAGEIGVEVGDRLAIELDRSDPAMRLHRDQLVPAAIEVVGLFEPLDPDAEAWSGDTDLLAAFQGGSDFHPIAYAAAYMSPEAYRARGPAAAVSVHVALRGRARRLDARPCRARRSIYGG
jgi:hypothetical protein